MSPAEVMRRLYDIEQALAKLEQPQEIVVGQLEGTEEVWKTLEATAFLAAEGKNQAERQAKARRVLMSQDQAIEVHTELVRVRAAVKKGRTRIDILSKRASILQSVLNGLRDHAGLPTEPQRDGVLG